MIDEAYLKDGSAQEDMAYNNYDYLTQKQWADLFAEHGLELVETVFAGDEVFENTDSSADMAAITRRAKELIEKHPDKKAMFEGYIRSQQSEYDDIDTRLEAVVWMLRKQSPSPNTQESCPLPA